MRGAGGGRPSKGAAARNRNKPTHEQVLLPPEGRSDPAPEIPDWLPVDAAPLWLALWSTPEASQWGEVDVPALARMVLMQTDGAVIEDPRLLAELRQLEDRFGLNPYARRQMKWVRADEVVEEGGERPTAPVMRLKAVDGHAVAGA